MPAGLVYQQLQHLCVHERVVRFHDLRSISRGSQRRLTEPDLDGTRTVDGGRRQMRRPVRTALTSAPVRANIVGAVLTEVAMVLVLFLTLTFSMFEAGRLIWSYTTLSNAVSEG